MWVEFERETRRWRRSLLIQPRDECGKVLTGERLGRQEQTGMENGEEQVHTFER